MPTERQYQPAYSRAMEPPLELDRFLLPDGRTCLVGQDVGDLATDRTVIVENRGSREANLRAALTLTPPKI